ncbi:MAG: DUF433 domain-containing protein [Acidimicrobiaceae bacterium]|nr:DUF433 domain-containing protein [Acidimicrobiaceae bacterium]MCY4293312.1 DUF433 domain-containing protein [Acidimicrobiaceae bacterium]
MTPPLATADIEHRSDTAARLSEGIYSFPQAADIVGRRNGVTRGQLRRWIAVVIAPTGETHSIDTISFLDLVSLETVRRFRDQGTSLQKVRKVLEALRVAVPSVARPLAHRSFFTDGVSVWADIVGRTEEIVGRNSQQLAFRDALRTFADEIRFVDDVAAAWDISPWVGIDPRVCFGAPVVRGTRIPVKTITANLTGATVEEVADWYELSIRQVRGVAEFYA